MKKIMCVLTLLLTVLTMNAQIEIPALSPAAEVTQQIGLAKATVTYSRPSLRGRQMLGKDHIPYGKVWRMGANTVTTLELSDDMLIEGKPLVKGKYAFVAIPDANEWTIVINSSAKQWGVYGYKPDKDVMRFKVKSTLLSPNLETLTIDFQDITPSESNIVFRWENVQFKIAVSQDSDAKVMADIKAKTADNPNNSTMMEAAEYYLMMNRDLEQALVWATKVLDKVKSPFRFNLKAQIAQKLGKCDVAIEAAKGAIESAEKNGDVAAKTLAQDILKSCEGKK